MLLVFHAQRDRLWIAAIALLMLASWLMPALVNAMQPEIGGKRWIFVCGSMQNKWVAVDADTTPDGETQVISNDCPLCHLHKYYPVIPTQARLAFAPSLISEVIAHKLAIFASRHSYHFASPRAPPVSMIIA